MPVSPDVLGQVPLFSQLKRKELERLTRHFLERRFAPGDEIMSEGNIGTGMYIVESGTAQVVRAGKVIATVGPAGFFGEIALIDGGTRTATVIAQTELLCHGLTAWDFRGIVEKDARISWALTQELARRLRANHLDDL